MDVSMPIVDGIEATRRMKRIHPSIKILILTSFAEQDYVIPALEAGADGYQLKEVEPDQLVASIVAVYRGSTDLHPKVTPAVFQPLSTQKQPKPSHIHTLTPRETEVLKEIASGKSNKEIAADLHITEQTVKTHVSNILAKLELDDRTQAALHAVKHRLVYSIKRISYISMRACHTNVLESYHSFLLFRKMDNSLYYII
ncbi:response regulator transcription factor [Bacillus sp. 165]|nr:response regulator transcription factor [Bacillus sp. 165]